MPAAVPIPARPERRAPARARRDVPPVPSPSPAPPVLRALDLLGAMHLRRVRADRRSRSLGSAARFPAWWARACLVPFSISCVRGVHVAGLSRTRGGAGFTRPRTAVPFRRFTPRKWNRGLRRAADRTPSGCTAFASAAGVLSSARASRVASRPARQHRGSWMGRRLGVLQVRKMT
jgi:hypothetical protein